jgi:hypothetical protein
MLSPPDGNLDEKEWLRAAATNPAFADLSNELEDIYSIADGKPIPAEDSRGTRGGC